MSSKEREARGGAFAVANPGPQMGQMHMPMPASSGSGGFGALPNPHSPPEGGSPGSVGGASGVLVHTDGGRVPEQPQEIPPTYDSIARE
ncbi:hypothetical protein B0H12DRAFT_1145887 [Mycena haematopus]|nr:hypothetical protein B0H12DRAFT_1145887 [Mycena haematopus]